MIHLKYAFTDIGHCRVCFTITSSANIDYHYCIQEEDENTIDFYRCTEDWEPIVPAWFNSTKRFVLDLPEDIDDYALRLIEDWKRVGNYQEKVDEDGTHYLQREDYL